LREQFFELQRELEGAQLRLNFLPEFESQILLFKAKKVSLNEQLHSLFLQVYISQVEKQGLKLSSQLESEAHGVERQSLLDVHKKEL
jgi:hypothetical protein